MSNKKEINNKGNSRLSLLKTFSRWLYAKDIRVLQWTPLIASFVIIFLYPTILYIVLDERSFTRVNLSGILPLASFIMSLSGVVGIIRKEVYLSPLLSLKDKAAVFYSIVFATICIIFGVFLIVTR